MPTPQPTAVNGGHTGPNQELSITGVMGTLGTFDVNGTAQTLPISVDKDSGAIFTRDLSFSGGGNIDAFGRFRVSNTNTLYDAQNQYSQNDLYNETIITGAGTSTFLPNESSVNLTVGTASGNKVVRQSREYFRYVPGKSFLVIMSRVMGTPKPGVRVRCGYYDANNGLFFENNGTSLGVVQRSYVSGTPVDTRVDQSNFNLDKLDGSGPSGINLNLNNANIFVTDFEWLGAGRVRMGIYGPEGMPVYCHEFRNANDMPNVYMTTANLPIRNSIETTGTTATATSLKVICSSVSVEDGREVATGLNTCASNGVNSGTITARRTLLNIRPKATFNGIVNRAFVTDLHSDIITDSNIYFEIIYNGTITGTPVWVSAGANSTVEYDVAGGSITGGIVLHSGYVGAGLKTTTTTNEDIISKLPFGLDSNGSNPTPISMVITPFTSPSVVSSTFCWKEIY